MRGSRSHFFRLIDRLSELALSCVVKFVPAGWQRRAFSLSLSLSLSLFIKSRKEKVRYR